MNDSPALQRLRKLIDSQQGRYLLAGGFNTLAGYFISLGMYYSLHPKLHLVVIAILTNIICITLSFTTQKLFVFRTAGNWLAEYLRSYVIYGGAMLLGIAGLWLLVDVLHVPFWLAQGGLLFISIAFSYLGHKSYTFKVGNGTHR